MTFESHPPKGDTKRGRWPRHLLTFLFVIAATILAVLNFTSTIEENEESHTLELLESRLLEENAKAEELAALEASHKRLETEYVMLEESLRFLYRTACRSLTEFIPILENSVVSFQPSRFESLPRSLLQMQLDMKGAFRYDATPSTIAFNVPKNGKHTLKIEALKTVFTQTAIRKNTGTVVFSETYQLESGKNYQTKLRFGDASHRKVFLSLTDHENIYIDNPFGQMIDTPFELKHPKQVVACPNQFTSKVQPATPFTSLAAYGFVDQSNKRMLGNGMLLVRLELESEGPPTSFPDDIHVVRKLLNELENGTETKFELNAEGRYEFEAN